MRTGISFRPTRRAARYRRAAATISKCPMRRITSGERTPLLRMLSGVMLLSAFCAHCFAVALLFAAERVAEAT